MYFIMSIYNNVKLVTLVESEPKAPFSIATTPMCSGGETLYPALFHFTLDPHLIMQSVKHQVPFFFSLWYDSTCHLTQVSQTIGKHFIH